MLNHKSGFLESSSTTLSTNEKEEEMTKLQEEDQESQVEKEVKYTSDSIHSLNNDNASFSSFEKHINGIDIKFLTKMG